MHILPRRLIPVLTVMTLAMPLPGFAQQPSQPSASSMPTAPAMATSPGAMPGAMPGAAAASEAALKPALRPGLKSALKPPLKSALNPAPKPAGKPVKQPGQWRLGLDLSATSSSGNENITVLTTGFKVTHLVKKNYELELAANYRYGRGGGKVVARRAKGSVNFELQPNADFSPFFFMSSLHDPFQKLNIRAHGGAGAKYHLVHTSDADAELSLAALYSYESFDLGASPPPNIAPFKRDGRLSWRFQGEKKLKSGVKVDNTTQYQPVWDNTGNYLLNSDTTARMLVSEHLSLMFGYTFERNSAPLPGVKPNDQLLRAGVSLEW